MNWRSADTTKVDIAAIRAFAAMALWDIRGKAWQRLLYDLLGGAFEGKIPTGKRPLSGHPRCDGHRSVPAAAPLNACPTPSIAKKALRRRNPNLL
jgi:L-alanine-DL-glutamate epimerase-like enolase superfamily enzyme